MTSTGSVVRVGVAVLISDPKEHPGCVLVGKRKGSHGSGTWAPPGGHLEVGESWEACAVREVAEETNLTLETPLHFGGVTNDIAIGGNPDKHYITIYMLATISPYSSELRTLEPHKCEGWQWVPWTDLSAMNREQPETIFDPLRNFITGGMTPFIEA